MATSTPTPSHEPNQGARRRRAPGAGQKAADGCTDLARKQIRLDPVSEGILLKVGGRNLSLGIREAARRIVEHADTDPFSFCRHDARG